MKAEYIIRVTAPDFVAGAVVDLDPPIIVMAADKLLLFKNKRPEKLINFCKSNGWDYELLR